MKRKKAFDICSLQRGFCICMWRQIAVSYDDTEMDFKAFAFGIHPESPAYRDSFLYRIRVGPVSPKRFFLSSSYSEKEPS